MSASPTIPKRVRGKSRAGGMVLGAIAWALLTLQVAKTLGATRELASIVVASMVPAMLSLTLLIGAVGVYYYGLDEMVWRISAWTVLGLSVFSVVLGGEILFLQSHLRTVPSPTILLVNFAAGGATLGFMVGFYDARQQQLRNELKDEYDRTVALSQRLSVMARILRHDLRNHLNVVVGEASRLRDLVDSAAASRSVEAIREASEDLVAISENVRTFGTILADPTSDRNVECFDVADVVSEAISTVRTRHDAVNVSFDVDVPEDVAVEASPFLPNALIELLENAVVHQGEDPHVRVRVDLDSASDDTVELLIEDDGPGIPESEVAVHDRTAETQLEHSTGVGLWLVQWVVSESDGHIGFESGTAGGTIVRVRLPRAT